MNKRYKEHPKTSTIYQRARARALSRLGKAHPDEYTTLYEEEKKKLKEEDGGDLQDK